LPREPTRLDVLDSRDQISFALLGFFLELLSTSQGFVSIGCGFVRVLIFVSALRAGFISGTRSCIVDGIWFVCVFVLFFFPSLVAPLFGMNGVFVRRTRGTSVTPWGIVASEIR